MVGPNYWTTGILLKWDGADDHDGLWSLHLEFLDDGFADKTSSEGTLRMRYSIKTADLAASIDLLIADAKRLGIEFKWPTFYVPQDGEGKGVPYHPEWKRIVAEQCKRLEWRNCYAGEPIFEESAAS